MYELWIKNENDTFVMADLGSDIPAMTYQTNDIAELKNRQANYSLAFKLPRTRNNRAIFHYADTLDVQTDFPYRKHDCRLYSNNHSIAGEGAYIVLNKVTDLYFECQILSGIADFFDELKKAPMSKLNLGTFNPNTNKAGDGPKETILTSWGPKEMNQYFIPAAFYRIKEGDTLYIKAGDLFPAVCIGYSMHKIVNSHGYTLISDMDWDWDFFAISICDKPKEDYSSYPIAPYLGFETQFDYFKAVCQAFGLTININETLKIVELYPIDILYYRKNYALDWTKKLHSKNIEQRFIFGSYGQENYILMQENKTTNIQDKGVFKIDNRLLEQNKELFTLPFESGNDKKFSEAFDGKVHSSVSEYTVAHIPLLEHDGTNATFKPGKPHLLNIKHSAIVFSDVQTIPFANHFNAEYLVSRFYSEIGTKLLKNAQILEAEFLLTPEDISLYNSIHPDSKTSGAFIPIYLQQTGAYYGINKITNFQEGKLTKVELIRL